MKTILLLKTMAADRNNLTPYEYMQFESAFTNIMRLSAVYDTHKEINVFTILSGGEKLPYAFNRVIGAMDGFGNVVRMFCPMNKDKAVRWLIEWCFDNKIQPSEFMLLGVLGVGIKQPYTVVHEFKDRDAA